MPPVTQLLQAVSDEQADQVVPDTVCAAPPALIRIVGRVVVDRVALTVADRTDSLPESSTAVTW